MTPSTLRPPSALHRRRSPLLAAPALRTAATFTGRRRSPAGNEVSIHNINGDIKVTPSTNGRVEVVGVKRGNGRDFDRIKADVQQTSRGITVCVLYDDTDSYCDERRCIALEQPWPRPRLGQRQHGSRGRGAGEPRRRAGSVSGDVDISGATATSRPDSVSGDVQLDHLHASSVRAQP